ARPHLLSLHDALPIYDDNFPSPVTNKTSPGNTEFSSTANAALTGKLEVQRVIFPCPALCYAIFLLKAPKYPFKAFVISSFFSLRSEEHTSELQSRENL